MAQIQAKRDERNPPFQLTFLAEFPHFVPILARWIYDEWGHQDPGNSLKQTVVRLQSRLNRDTPPTTLVGLVDAKPIACASIKLRELKAFPQFEHWLGSVYVLEERRGHGYGSAIVDYSSRVAEEIGIAELYLYTHSHEAFYSHLGFTPVERPMLQGRKILIMKKILNPTLMDVT